MRKTFLDLFKDLKREAGVSGPTPSTVVGQTGEYERLVNWILKAYEDIQNKHTQWEFLRADVEFTVANPTSTYSADDIDLPTFGEWKMDSFRIYSSAVGVADEQILCKSSWDAFRNSYVIGALRSQAGRPTVIAQKPDQSLILWPLPDQDYTVVGEYYKTAQTLTANTDVPIFPAKYHDIIMWRALMFYAGYESAPSLYTVGEREFNKLMMKMEATQLPEMVAGGAMA